MAASAHRSTTRELPAPLLPRPAGGGEDPEALRVLRRFHLDPTAQPPEEDSGTGGRGAGERPLPALLAPLADLERVRTDEPFVVLPAEDGETRLHLLPDWLHRWLPRGETPILAELTGHLERRVRHAVAEGGPSRPARPVLEEALAGLADEMELAEAGAERLTAEAEAALARVPGEARLVPLGSGTALELLLLILAHRRPAVRESLAAEVAHGADALATLLGSEGGESAGPEGRLSAQLGSAGRFLDPSVLASRLGSRHRRGSLGEEARATLQRDLEILEGFPAACGEGEVTVVGTEADDPFAEAARRWDAAADRLAGVLRALRRTELAVAGDWRPERHDPWLERLDRRALTPRERVLVPPVVVSAEAAGGVGEHLASLTHLLLSDRPVQVLLTVDPLLDPLLEPGEGSGSEASLEEHRFEVGLYGLALEHPYVQQGTAARPLALVEGFRRALDGARPALHVVAEGAEPPGGPFWRAAGAALESRAHPLFRWDPAAGPRWAERFTLADNPAPEEDWPTGTLLCRHSEGREESLETTFTFADFALLSRALAGHFHPLPEGVPDGELVSVAAALETAEDELRRLPFLWVVVGAEPGASGEPRLERRVISRPLLRACRDRLDTWHDLQERAGVGSPYVTAARRAVERSWEERWAEERQRLEQGHARELADVRRRAAEAAVDRLATALLAGPLMEGTASPTPPDGEVPKGATAGVVPGRTTSLPRASVPQDPERVAALAERLRARLAEEDEATGGNGASAPSPAAEALAERWMARLGDPMMGSMEDPGK